MPWPPERPLEPRARTPDLPLSPRHPQPAKGGPSTPFQLSGAMLQAGPEGRGRPPARLIIGI